MINPKIDVITRICDIRPENIETFTETYTPEGGEEQTVIYKRVSDHPILNGIKDKLAFFVTHAGAVWYNKQANRTVADEIKDLNAKIPIIKSGKAKVSFTNGLGTLVHNFPEEGYQIFLSAAGYVGAVPAGQDRPANQIPMRAYMASNISADANLITNLTRANVEVEYLIIKS